MLAPLSDSFYPPIRGAQIDWNTNILSNAALLSTPGFTAAQIMGITNDCTLTIYLLTNIREMADRAYGSLHGFAKAMEKSPLGTAPPCLGRRCRSGPPPPPALVAPGITARRSAWVVTSRKSPNHNPDTNGRTLRLEPVVMPSNPTTYVAECILADLARTPRLAAAARAGLRALVL